MNTCRIAGMDVHKKMLAVVVTDVATEGELQFERRQFGATSEQVQVLVEWLTGLQVQSAVMESTATGRQVRAASGAGKFQPRAQRP